MKSVEGEVGVGRSFVVSGLCDGSDSKTFDHQRTFHGRLLLEPLQPHNSS